MGPTAETRLPSTATNPSSNTSREGFIVTTHPPLMVKLFDPAKVSPAFCGGGSEGKPNLIDALVNPSGAKGLSASRFAPLGTVREIFAGSGSRLSDQAFFFAASYFPRLGKSFGMNSLV